MNSESIFDLIVIGTGSAASATAHECRSKGWSVADNRFITIWRHMSITWMRS